MKIKLKICKYEIENSECEKLLGVKLDWQLDFDALIQNCAIYRIIRRTYTTEHLF